MHRSVFFVLVVAASIPSPALAEPAAQARTATAASTPQFDAALEARRARLVGGLKPALRPKLDATIQEVQKRAQPPVVVPGKPAPPVPDLAAVARASVAGLARAENVGIETLVQIVLLEAAKAADQDLKVVLAELKALNERKQALRAAAAALKASRDATKSTKACASLACIDALPPSAEYTIATMAAVKRSLLAVPEDSRLDSLSDASSADEFHLQSAGERRAKFLEVLSNLLKKLSETSDTITQNFK